MKSGLRNRHSFTFSGVVFLFALGSHAGDIGMPVGIHEAARFTGAWQIDGRLDEPGWRDLTPQTRFYAFSTPGTGPSPAGTDLETVFFCGYTDDGILLGIECLEKSMDRLRDNIRGRDDGSLWTDDCVEIYIAPLPRRDLGFHKFIVNSSGTVCDAVNRAEGSVDTTWNDAGWQAGTSKKADRWQLEAFFPWSSVGMSRRPESGIALGLCRFSYTTGSFRGASWGPGMGFPFIDKAGMVFFDRGFISRIGASADELTHIHGPSWYAETDGGIVSYVDKQAAIRSLGKDVRDAWAETAFLLGLLPASAARDGLSKTLDGLRPAEPGLAPRLQANDYAGALHAASKKIQELEALRETIKFELVKGNPREASDKEKS